MATTKNKTLDDLWQDAREHMQWVETDLGDRVVGPACTSCLDTPEFRAAWLNWVAFRRDEIEKPVTEYVAKRTIPRLEEWGHDRAIDAIRHSMDRGWVWIYEDSGGGDTKRSPARVQAPPGKYKNVRIHRK